MQSINQFDCNAEKRNRKQEDFISIVSKNSNTRQVIVEKYLLTKQNKRTSFLSPFFREYDNYQFKGVFAEIIRKFQGIDEKEMESMREDYLSALKSQCRVSDFSANLLEKLKTKEPVVSRQARL